MYSSDSDAAGQLLVEAENARSGPVTDWITFELSGRTLCRCGGAGKLAPGSLRAHWVAIQTGYGTVPGLLD